MNMQITVGRIFALLFPCMCFIGGGNTQPTRGQCCPNGWLAWAESCYRIEPYTKAVFSEAQQACRSQQATLFSADSLEEFDAIRQLTPFALWTWIGAKASHYTPQHAAGNFGTVYGPQWSAENGMDLEQLPWLNKLAPHGLSTLTECIAIHNTITNQAYYVDYYPCHYRHYYVCESNRTQPRLNPRF